MHDATAITLHPRPSRHVTLGVIVVAAAHVQEIGGELDRLASRADSREPRAHDQDIEVLDALRLLCWRAYVLGGCSTGHRQCLSSLIHPHQSWSESYISPRIASTAGGCKKSIKTSN